MNLAAVCFFVAVSMSTKFPDAITQWKYLIDSVASRECVDADLIGAVMQKESMGNSTVRSYSGAVGLMQIMPSDNEMSSISPSYSIPAVQLLDPFVNVSRGAGMLRQTVAKSDGNLIEALARYNCGEVGIVKDMCGHGGGYDYAWSVIGFMMSAGNGSVQCVEINAPSHYKVHDGKKIGCYYAASP